MILTKPFPYRVTENEKERASNGYLMSVIAIIAGMPLPIINVLATLFFYLANRKGTYFVRWHCMQALLSQLSVLCINSVGFWWTISVILQEKEPTNLYFAYIISAFLFNLTEFIATIYTAVQTRKGEHISWWFYGDLTETIVQE
ncbi:DUF4870 domain-containing protein [Capnocytophaga canimorsus]|uniref:DUF4870 domain-containing protein n=1 Tax=Capnocytophaga canimorsus TaxID=28188 RepID=UPI0005898AA9|nr:DUF4870 domain-containing protein [Capnocytophaga canimorsus]ATA77063.1 DUF4870 domain-containing protein [Capnocytophaga canimorsus]PJI83799.1 uncharacterized protein DUF4870 [Capnocytophaga canimorsus]CEN45637.1 conserved membrane hypothetical protein [Capnocytophaga canimorsus]STA72274.1 Uncharacterized protein conserved in bacteria [Capnocytophaga canimorsus]VEJ19133.1 Uncharacterized protein conserved in bacteria [Capnocytophaga canimorsus]